MERPWIRHGNFDSDFKTTRPPGAEPASEPVSSQAWNYCRQNPRSQMAPGAGTVFAPAVLRRSPLASCT